MNNKSSKLEKDSWREEFQKAFVKNVDLPLFNELLESISCSQRMFSRITKSSRWPVRLYKDVHRVNYPNIRIAADFLGIPPWLLFERNAEEEIKQFFRKASPSLKARKIYMHSQALNHYFTFSNRIKLKKKQRKLLQESISNIDKIFKEELIPEGSWKWIYELIESAIMGLGGYDNFSWGSIIKFKTLERTVYSGTLRICNFIDREENYWARTAWLAFEKHNKEIGDNFSIDIEGVIDDITYLVGSRTKPWKFSIYDQYNDRHKVLYSWHTDRRLEYDDKEITSHIQSKLPEAVLALHNKISGANTYTNFNTGELINSLFLHFEDFYNLIEEDLMQLLKEVNKHQFVINTNDNNKQKYKNRRENTLPHLYKIGYLQEGTQLLFNNKLNTKYDNDDIKMYSTVVIKDGKPKVKWNYDNKIYSLTGLSKKLIKESNLNVNTRSLNGCRLWSLENKTKSLAKVADQFYKKKSEEDNSY